MTRPRDSQKSKVYLADQYWLDLASTLAYRSPNRKWRHGCYIVKSGIVLGQGTNSVSYGVDDPPFSEHAEESALDGLSPTLTVGATAYLARVRRSGALGLSRPCAGCTDVLRRYGIMRVVWTGIDGALTVGYLNESEGLFSEAS